MAAFRFVSGSHPSVIGQGNAVLVFRSAVVCYRYTWYFLSEEGGRKMSPRIIFIISVASAMLLSGCVTPAPVDTRNGVLTQGNVKMHIEVGKTTQAEVLRVFGAPNITTINSDSENVWVYQRQATVSQSASSQNYWTVVLLGGSSGASGFKNTQRTITLIIKFNEQDIVSGFRSRATQF